MKLNEILSRSPVNKIAAIGASQSGCTSTFNNTLQEEREILKRRVNQNLIPDEVKSICKRINFINSALGDEEEFFAPIAGTYDDILNEIDLNTEDRRQITQAIKEIKALKVANMANERALKKKLKQFRHLERQNRVPDFY